MCYIEGCVLATTKQQVDKGSDITDGNVTILSHITTNLADAARIIQQAINNPLPLNPY